VSLESTATSARPKTRSLRATIPEGIVAFLELKNGDKIEWKMQSLDKDRVAVVAKKRGAKKK